MSVGVQIPISPKEFWFSGLDARSIPFFYLERDSLSGYDYVLGLCNVNQLRKKKENKAQKCSSLGYWGILFLSSMDRTAIGAMKSTASMYGPFGTVSQKCN